MKHIKLLLLFIVPSFLGFGQINLEENNKKLFINIPSDTLYKQTGNIISINLKDFPKGGNYFYRCKGGMIIAKGRNLITINPYGDSVLLDVLMDENTDPKNPTANHLLIGKKKFRTRAVPTPKFFIKMDSVYFYINNNDSIKDLSLPILIFPSIEFKEKYSYDSKYFIEMLVLKFKRNNKIIINKILTEKMQSLIISNILSDVLLEKGDTIEVTINKYYRLNFQLQKFNSVSPIKLVVVRN
jgi:hypothetical protein